MKIPWAALDESHHIVLHNHPGEGEFLLPSDADIAIARELGTPGYGFYLASKDGMHAMAHTRYNPDAPVRQRLRARGHEA